MTFPDTASRLVPVCLGGALLLAVAADKNAAAKPDDKAGGPVREALSIQERVRVLVMLDVPIESAMDLTATRAFVASVQDSLLARLRPDDFVVRRRMAIVPAIAGEVSRDGLARLIAAPEVRRVDLDEGGTGGLAQAVPLTNTDDVHALGIRGNGVTVAVLDSGIDTNHPDLGADLVAEACFCSGGGGCCPGGTATRFGAGAAEDDNGHGSNVSGIVTSTGIVAPVGTAPGAGIVSIKVLDSANSFCCTSDVVAGLDWIINSRPDVDVVNMSLGTSAMYTGDCDNANSFTMAFAAAVNLLRSRGVLSFVSTGNTRSTTQMQAPACIANAISVAAVYDANVGSVTIFSCTDSTTAADKVTCFSNRNAFTDILGPGAPITSWSRFGGTSTYYGTSQASPHVAGCAANLLEAFPGLAPSALEAALESTGRSVTDAATGRTYPRVDCLAALHQLACVDADMDGFPRSALCPSGIADCDDANAARFPGNPEICDGVDNDCNGTIPPGELAAPGAIGALTIGPANIVWGSDPVASGYDIVRGDLDFLRLSGGDFSASVIACLANDAPAPSVPLPAGPPSGGGEWYLVRGESCFGSGSYDAGAASQIGSRDGEIAASAFRCP